MVSAALGSVLGTNAAPFPDPGQPVNIHGSKADKHWNSVVLLLPLNGADDTTSTTDVSDLNNHPDTFINTTVLHSRAARWGSTGLSALSGTTGGISIPHSTSLSLTGTGAFTIECWARWVTTLQDINVGLIEKNGNWQFYWGGSGTDNLIFAVQFDVDAFWDFQIDFNWTPTIDTWYHLAAERTSAGVYRLYIDGTQVATSTDATALVDNNSLATTVGSAVSGTARPMNWTSDGWLDDVRVTTVARYQGNFNVPTRAFPTKG